MSRRSLQRDGADPRLSFPGKAKAEARSRARLVPVPPGLARAKPFSPLSAEVPPLPQHKAPGAAPGLRFPRALAPQPRGPRLPPAPLRSPARPTALGMLCSVRIHITVRSPVCVCVDTSVRFHQNRAPALCLGRRTSRPRAGPRRRCPGCTAPPVPARRGGGEAGVRRPVPCGAQGAAAGGGRSCHGRSCSTRTARGSPGHQSRPGSADRSGPQGRGSGFLAKVWVGFSCYFNFFLPVLFSFPGSAALSCRAATAAG